MWKKLSVAELCSISMDKKTSRRASCKGVLSSKSLSLSRSCYGTRSPGGARDTFAVSDPTESSREPINRRAFRGSDWRLQAGTSLRAANFRLRWKTGGWHTSRFHVARLLSVLPDMRGRAAGAVPRDVRSIPEPENRKDPFWPAWHSWNFRRPAAGCYA